MRSLSRLSLVCLGLSLVNAHAAANLRLHRGHKQQQLEAARLAAATDATADARHDASADAQRQSATAKKPCQPGGGPCPADGGAQAVIDAPDAPGPVASCRFTYNSHSKRTKAAANSKLYNADDTRHLDGKDGENNLAGLSDPKLIASGWVPQHHNLPPQETGLQQDWIKHVTEIAGVSEKDCTKSQKEGQEGSKVWHFDCPLYDLAAAGGTRGPPDSQEPKCEDYYTIAADGRVHWCVLNEKEDNCAARPDELWNIKSYESAGAAVADYEQIRQAMFAWNKKWGCGATTDGKRKMKPMSWNFHDTQNRIELWPLRRRLQNVDENGKPAMGTQVMIYAPQGMTLFSPIGVCGGVVVAPGFNCFPGPAFGLDSAFDEVDEEDVEAMADVGPEGLEPEGLAWAYEKYGPEKKGSNTPGQQLVAIMKVAQKRVADAKAVEKEGEDPHRFNCPRLIFHDGDLEEDEVVSQNTKVAKLCTLCNEK